MKANVLFQWLMIALTFVIAFVLEIMPWPAEFRGYRPAWVVFGFALLGNGNSEDRVNIGIAFLIGLVWDLIFRLNFGHPYLNFIHFAYLIAVNSMILRNLSLSATKPISHFVRFSNPLQYLLVGTVLHSAVFDSQEFIGAVLSGVLWPWLFLILRGLRRKPSTTLIRAGDRRQRSDNGFHQRCQRNNKDTPKSPTNRQDNRYNNRNGCKLTTSENSNVLINYHPKFG